MLLDKQEKFLQIYLLSKTNSRNKYRYTLDQYI